MQNRKISLLGEKAKMLIINFRAAEPRGVRRIDSVALNLLLHLDF